MALLCADCSMVFSSGSLLQRHQAQLCVGKAAGDPIAARKEPETQAADRGIGAEPWRTTTPELIKMRSQKSCQQKRNNNQGIIDAAPNPDRVEEEKRPRRQENHPLKTLSDEVPGGRAGQDTRLRLMEERTELHKTRLAQIHDHNQQLQRQREELFQQMGALSGQTTASHLENLLVQQKDKEDRSEEMLRQLTRRLDTLQVESIATNQPGPDRNRAHSLNFDLLRSSTDGPLSSQIREMQAAYVQSGGSDPGLLAQMMDLQREAQRLEQAPLEAEAKGRRKKVRPYRRGPNRELLALEAENRRLEHEILQIQAVRPYGDQGSSSLSLVEAELQQEQLYCMVDIKAEMEALRLEIRERSKGVARTCRQAPPPPPPSQRPPPPVYPAQQAPNPLVRWTRSVDEGYDSAPGDVPRMDRRDPRVELVLFYDMVVGIDARLSMLRLVSSLYLGEQQMGLPAPLPCVLCQPGVEMPFSQQLPPGGYAPLLVKQPVPRLCPYPGLCLVMEVHGPGARHGPRRQEMMSLGWARLELFDLNSQLHRGYWKVPVRSLPVTPAKHQVDLDSVPQVGHMEILLRVAGPEGDAPVQPGSSAPGQYEHPIVVSSHAVPVPVSVTSSTTSLLSHEFPITANQSFSGPIDQNEEANQSSEEVDDQIGTETVDILGLEIK